MILTENAGNEGLRQVVVEWDWGGQVNGEKKKKTNGNISEEGKWEVIKGSDEVRRRQSILKDY